MEIAKEPVDRRLSAILAADIAGYSSLMSTDELRTVRELKGHQAVVLPMIGGFGGRIIDTAGDGILAEFTSVVNAIKCAVAIQSKMSERNAGIDPQCRMQFRIGVNIGEVIFDEARIYGDGINVAARLESIAEPGGICVSGKVFEEINGRVDLAYQDIGDQQLKNIARPVRVFRVRLGSDLAGGAPSLPDKPSIAVLPFLNIGGDPEQEYFSDGITEDIITALSRLRWFFVIARNSSFAYKAKAIDIKRVARELGVRYVLEGSVRKGGSRVRITSQLIEAATGNHIWAERYDGDLTDVFALQDEITKKVVAAIEPRLLEAEGLRSQRRSPQDLGAWEMLIRANSLFWRLTKNETETAIGMLQRVVERYPDYAPGYSLLAFMLLVSGYIGARLTQQQLQQATELSTRAAELDDSDPSAHLALGFAAFMTRQSHVAVAEFHRALSINPNFAAAHGYLGWALAFDGQVDLASAHLEEAIRLSPQDPQNAIFNTGLAITRYLAGRYAEAVDYSRKALQQRTAFTGGYRIHVASLAQAGQLDEARAALARLKESHPDLSIAWIEKNVPYSPGPMVKFLDAKQA